MNKYFALAAIAAVTVFSSCKKSDDAEPASTPPQSWSAKLLGSQTNSNGSFFSPTTGVVYKTSDSATFATNKVDISFAQIGATTTTPTFLSLDEREDAGLNRVISVNRSTSFALTSLTKAQFDTVSNEYLDNFAPTAGTVGVTQGKVYSFKNNEGLIGLIYVSNLSVTNPTNSEVTIDVKFQKN